MFWKNLGDISTEDVISYIKEMPNFLLKHRWLAAAGFMTGSLCALRIYSTCTAGICKCTTNMNGKLVVITGGNSGIGKATAMEMARHGAKVIIASRNTALGKAAVRDVVQATGNKNVEFSRLDLTSFDSVREFAQNLREKEGKLDVLINNAGVTGPGSETIKITRDMCEYIMQCNYYGHFLLTHCVLDLLKKCAQSRIINVSSAMYKWAKLDLEDLNSAKNYKAVDVYNKSKLANVLFTMEMAKRLQNTGVTVNVLHPGIVKTNIVKNTPFLESIVTKLLFVLVGKTPLQGAQTAIHLALAPELEQVSGKYFSGCKEQKLVNVKENEHVAYQLYRTTLKIVKVPPVKVTEDEEAMPEEGA